MQSSNFEHRDESYQTYLTVCDNNWYLVDYASITCAIDHRLLIFEALDRKMNHMNHQEKRAGQ